MGLTRGPTVSGVIGVVVDCSTIITVGVLVFSRCTSTAHVTWFSGGMERGAHSSDAARLGSPLTRGTPPTEGKGVSTGVMEGCGMVVIAPPKPTMLWLSLLRVTRTRFVSLSASVTDPGNDGSDTMLTLRTRSGAVSPRACIRSKLLGHTGARRKDTQSVKPCRNTRYTSIYRHISGYLYEHWSTILSKQIITNRKYTKNNLISLRRGFKVLAKRSQKKISFLRNSSHYDPSCSQKVTLQK